jgi:hypothetical protein
VTYMALSIPGGNAIDCWDTEEDALKWVAYVLEAEPDAADSFGVLEFDEDGMVTRSVYPEETV